MIIKEKKELFQKLKSAKKQELYLRHLKQEY